MGPATPITVRVQALGGLFLSKNSYGEANITITDVQTGNLLAQGPTTTTPDDNSGTPELVYNPNSSSPNAIVTPSGSSSIIHWATAVEPTPDRITVNFSATLYLLKPTLVEIKAEVPLPPSQGNQYISVTQWLIPGRSYTAGAGFVLWVPGLWVDSPNITVNSGLVTINANVKMMCGCKIQNDNSNPWNSSDFLVTGTLTDASGNSTTYVLNYKSTNPNESLFSVTSGQQFGAGTYTLTVSASQNSTNNAGVATVPVTI